MRTAVTTSALVLFAVCAHAGDGVSIRQMSFQGLPAPSAPAGATFGLNAGVAIGDSGLMVYENTLIGGGLSSSNNQFLYAIRPTDPPTFTLLARDLDSVPGLANYQYLAPSINSRLSSRLVVSPTDEIGVQLTVRNLTTLALGSGVLVGTPGAGLLPTIVQTAPAPGFAGQNVGGIIGPFSLRINGATMVSGRVNTPNADVLWRGFATAMDPIVSTGTQVATLPAGQTIQDIVNDSALMDQTGRLFYAATIDNAPLSSDRGVFLGDTPATAPLFLEGDTPPGVPGAVITSAVEDTMRIVGTEGVISYVSRTSGVTDAVLITGGSSTYTTLIKDGDPRAGLPDLTVDRLDFGRVVLTGDGKTAFSCRLVGAPFASDSAIFRGDPGGLQLVLREGDPLPGGGTVPDLQSAFAPWLFNTRGQLAIVMNDGIGEGLYCTRPDGEMFLLVRTGEVFTTDGGASYNAFDIQQNGQGGFSVDSGRQSWFNNNGQIAMEIRTVGGSNQGLFLLDVENVPCPADFDGDDDVDLGDFGVFGGAFGSVLGDANYNPDADFDSDGDVDLGDFGVFGGQFGSGPATCGI